MPYALTPGDEDLRRSSLEHFVSPQLLLLWLVCLSHDVISVSSVHVLNTPTKRLNVGAVGVSVIPGGHRSQPPDCGFVFLFFSTFWCYSSGIQSLSPNLSPLHHTLPHPLCSLMHTLKRTGGPTVGCGRGVGGCVRVTEGYIQPPVSQRGARSLGLTLRGCYRLLLSLLFLLSFLFSSWREPIMSYKLTGKMQNWMP